MGGIKLSGTYFICSNCQKQTPEENKDEMLTFTHQGVPVGQLCSACQKAKKIQITFQWDEKYERWDFAQYFPVEV